MPSAGVVEALDVVEDVGACLVSGVATLGVAIYWNSTSKLATVTASGNTKIDVAVEAAGAGVASIKVRLSGF